MKYKCPFCGEFFTEAEDVGDCGCPSCRRCIDMEDFGEVPEWWTEKIMEKYADNGKIIEDYDKILPPENGFFVHIPGVYCKSCGETFALYSFSAHQPDGVDENNKPYYNHCFCCVK